MPDSRVARPRPRRLQRGAALIASLLLLLVTTLLAMTTMRNSTLEQRMAANSTFRNAEFQVAESALVQAIAEADYGSMSASANGASAAVAVTSKDDRLDTEAVARPLGGTASQRTPSGFSMGRSSNPAFTQYLFEIEIEAEFEDNDDFEPDITAGISYGPKG